MSDFQKLPKPKVNFSIFELQFRFLQYRTVEYPTKAIDNCNPLKILHRTCVELTVRTNEGENIQFPPVPFRKLKINLNFIKNFFRNNFALNLSKKKSNVQLKVD